MTGDMPTRLDRVRNTVMVPLAAMALYSGLAGPAAAYVGPGAGLTAIGSALALVAAIFLAIVGFVWYPIKRLIKRKPAGSPPVSRDITGDNQ
jgi:hypothetical protein